MFDQFRKKVLTQTPVQILVLAEHSSQTISHKLYNAKNITRLVSFINATCDIYFSKCELYYDNDITQ